jgi:hypothetical protein
MAKKNLQKQYEQQLAELERGTLIQVIQQNPKATLEEIYTLVEGGGGVGITIEEICGKVRAVKKGRPGPKKGSKPRATGRLDTRTQVGRDKLDKMVLSRLKLVKKKRWASSDLRKLTGATEHQLRASLTRLIESGKAKWEGSTNQTRYFAA